VDAKEVRVFYRRDATFVAGAAFGGLATWGVLCLWTAMPWLSFFLDYNFWTCCAALTAGLGVLAGMYFNRIGTSRHSRAGLSAVVLLLCTIAFPAMVDVSEHFEWYAKNDPDKLVRRVLLLVDLFMQSSMLVLTLGVAALAVNLLASAFPDLPRQINPK
jgi:hypothetical protein